MFFFYVAHGLPPDVVWLRGNTDASGYIVAICTVQSSA